MVSPRRIPHPEKEKKLLDELILVFVLRDFLTDADGLSFISSLSHDITSC